MSLFKVKVITNISSSFAGTNKSAYMYAKVTNSKGEYVLGLTQSNFTLHCDIVPPGGSGFTIESVEEQINFPVGKKWDSTPGIYKLKLKQQNDWLEGVYLSVLLVVRNKDFCFEPFSVKV
ncbi:MAG TPA: hypothetical protein PK431_05620 [Chitinophagales bacterium]|nr:hypothetical protein [Chitinophagales bacterium]